MSLFGDLDIASAADDPFNIDEGMYRGVVTAAQVKKSNDGTKKGFVLTYTVTDEESPMVGRKIDEWKNLPQPEDPDTLTPDEERDRSFLKMRLRSLGVEEEEMNTVGPDDLIGKDVVFTVKKKGDYTNVVKVELDSGDTAGW